MNEQNNLNRDFLPPVTAGIFPKRFSDELAFLSSGKITAIFLIVMIAIGFGLRVNKLGAESLGEDELNKLQTVEEYRTNGLSGKNGEHPFLMKGLQTASVSIGERLGFSDEASLRFPIALFGTFTALILFLLVGELFGRSIALVAAALYAVEPVAIGFDRIAKEDSLVLFFFLLTNLLWIRGQTLAERGFAYWPRYAFGAGVAFAALMASKYYPHLLAVTAGYYNIYEYVPERNWRFGRPRWLLLMVVMAVAFVVFNPTIVLPETWSEMLKFSSENRIGHDGYEYMGELYTHKATAWLGGIPWTFYYVFIAVKTSLPVLVLFLIGLPLMFLRRLGDGRFFIFFWAFMWFVPFSVLGGKFTRYFTLAEPIILITAATGFYFSVKWLSSKLKLTNSVAVAFQSFLFIAVIAVSIFNSASSGPHYRLFTNTIGGAENAGYYFPHDEFYDAQSRDVVKEIIYWAKQNVTVACETPTVYEYYAAKLGRSDLKFVSLSDKTKVATLKANDFVVDARGRRYFSNTAYLDLLQRMESASKTPVDVLIDGFPAARVLFMGSPNPISLRVTIGDLPAARVYLLDEQTVVELRKLAEQ